MGVAVRGHGRAGCGPREGLPLFSQSPGATETLQVGQGVPGVLPEMGDKGLPVTRTQRGARPATVVAVRWHGVPERTERCE